MSSVHVDTFEFSSLEDLRDWLNRFSRVELSKVLPNSGEFFVLDWYEENLSDGSQVFNADINTPDISLAELQRRLANLED